MLAYPSVAPPSCMMTVLPYVAIILTLAGFFRLLVHYNDHDDGDPDRRYTLRHLLGITFPLFGLIDCMILALPGNKKLGFDLLLLGSGMALLLVGSVACDRPDSPPLDEKAKLEEVMRKARVAL